MRFNRLFGAMLCVAQLGWSFNALAERFVTWVDEDGQVRHTRVKEPETQKSKAPVAPAQTEGSVVVPAEAEGNAQPAALSGTNDIVEEVQALRESGALKEAAPGEAKENLLKGGSTEDVYIDAEQLEQQGFVREGQQKFYTWIDSEGNLRSAPIGQSEKAVVVFEPKKQQHTIVAREQFLSRQASEGPAADPEALKILGLSGPQEKIRDIDRLAAICCDQFKDTDPEILRGDEDQVVYFDGSEEMMDFGLGYSHYRLIKLPESLPKESVFSLQSYIRRSMFSPVVVTLDETFKPVRMLTDVLYVYEAGTWYKHAYMEGYFKIPSVQKEPYLLVLSRNVDQVSTTVVDGLAEEPILIPHASKGELYLSLIQ